MNDYGPWITIEAYCDKYGERANTIQKRVHDGVWPRGEFYSSPSNGRAYIHEARAVAWLKEKGKL